mgnify:CR=1 FL=1
MLSTKEDTIKKRLLRARQRIKKSDISFQIPLGKDLHKRLESVMEVLYLIFNEGFHSNSKKQVIRTDLCNEAMRLCQLLLKKEPLRTPDIYALFALMCFHASRLDTKTNSDNEILDLKQQDRSKWLFPLIKLGNSIMNKAVETNSFSCYHYEAAIAAEHLKAKTFEDTNWDKILQWYEALYKLQPMPSHLLSMAVISIQNCNYDKAKDYFNKIQPADLNQREYLFYAAKADYYSETKNIIEAINSIDKALKMVTNSQEKIFLQKKKSSLLNK